MTMGQFIRCDKPGCNREIQGRYGEPGLVRKARQEGWFIGSTNKQYCPAHYPKRLKRNKGISDDAAPDAAHAQEQEGDE